jgi:hypothetical protein
MKLSMGAVRKLAAVNSRLLPCSGVELQSVQSGGRDLFVTGLQGPAHDAAEGDVTQEFHLLLGIIGPDYSGAYLYRAMNACRGVCKAMGMQAVFVVGR